MALNTSPVSIGDTATASQYNNLRKDIIQYAGDYGTLAGGTTAYTLDVDNAFALVEKVAVKFKVNATNTGASTLNVESTGVKDMKKKSDNGLVALQAGDLVINQVYYAIYDGTQWVIIDILNAAPFVSPLSGEAFSADYALYLKASDGKTYKADATSIGEAVENFIGFASAAAGGAGTAIKVKSGPIVNLPTLTLTVGAIYYLTNTAGVISTTPGTIFKPIGFAISATDLYIFPSQAYRRLIGNQTLSLPAAGGTADTTITLPFLPKSIDIHGDITLCNSAGAGCEYVVWHAHYDQTTIKGVTVFKSPSSAGNVAPDTIAYQTTAPVATCRSGTNQSSLTLTVNSVSATSIVFRVTNTITAGSGSTNAQGCHASFIIEA